MGRWRWVQAAFLLILARLTLRQVGVIVAEICADVIVKSDVAILLA